MAENSKEKHYDLEERTERFAGDVSILCNKLARTISNLEHCKQVVRSSGSIGSNYIEANEAVSKKDFIYRAKICRKEAKETAMWLRVMMRTNTGTENEQLTKFLEEAIELKKILSAIINKSSV
ncbi:MAG: four helix bundle protein [Bacteroidota bacterium]